MASPTNTESIIFYQGLILDAEDGIRDAESIEDLQSRESVTETFRELIKGHGANIARLKTQAESEGTSLVTEIKEFIEKYEGWLKTFGGILGPEVKKWIERLIEAAKKLLES